MAFRRQGVTLLELIAVIGIVGLLVAILLPAIQMAREAARQSSCTNNVRQIGIGLQSYHDSNGAFPSYNLTSPLVALLPFLGAGEVYDSLNGYSHTPDNSTFRMSTVRLFMCPSDPSADLSGPTSREFPASYAGNFGTGVQTYGYNGLFQKWRIAVSGELIGPIRAVEILDGLAHTAAFSEILVGDGSDSPNRVVFKTPVAMGQPQQLEDFAALCSVITAETAADVNRWTRGRPWYAGNELATLYNHVLGPNRNSCSNQALGELGASSASSLHPGNVTLLYADGHVTSIAESIELVLWRAMGSRNGSETKTGGALAW